jgi:hypothetical protein
MVARVIYSMNISYQRVPPWNISRYIIHRFSSNNENAVKALFSKHFLHVFMFIVHAWSQKLQTWYCLNSRIFNDFFFKLSMARQVLEHTNNHNFSQRSSFVFRINPCRFTFVELQKEIVDRINILTQSKTVYLKDILNLYMIYLP